MDCDTEMKFGEPLGLNMVTIFDTKTIDYLFQFQPDCNFIVLGRDPLYIVRTSYIIDEVNQVSCNILYIFSHQFLI